MSQSNIAGFHAYQAMRALCPCASPSPESSSSDSSSLVARVAVVSAILSLASFGGWFVWDRCFREDFDGDSSSSSGGSDSAGSSSSACGSGLVLPPGYVVGSVVLTTPIKPGVSTGSCESSTLPTPATSDVEWDSPANRGVSRVLHGRGVSPVVPVLVPGDSPPVPEGASNNVSVDPNASLKR